VTVVHEEKVLKYLSLTDRDLLYSTFLCIVNIIGVRIVNCKTRAYIFHIIGYINNYHSNFSGYTPILICIGY
jgi:hypothetical protein